jgi:HSP20 family molecular chaperone IbpA
VDIFESDDRISVLADMPGVKPQDLKIDLRDSTLTLSGRVESDAGKGEASIATEYQSGTYFRQFTLSEMIDQAKIEAKLIDGVLHLDLPKAERAKPRQINVRTS